MGADSNSALPFPEHNFVVFIIFSWNYELFWSSLQTYMAAGWGKRVIIIDNSPDRIILNDPGNFLCRHFSGVSSGEGCEQRIMADLRRHM